MSEAKIETSDGKVSSRRSAERAGLAQGRRLLDAALRWVRPERRLTFAFATVANDGQEPLNFGPQPQPTPAGRWAKAYTRGLRRGARFAACAFVEQEARARLAALEAAGAQYLARLEALALPAAPARDAFDAAEQAIIHAREACDALRAQEREAGAHHVLWLGVPRRGRGSAGRVRTRGVEQIVCTFLAAIDKTTAHPAGTEIEA